MLTGHPSKPSCRLPYPLNCVSVDGHITLAEIIRTGLPVLGIPFPVSVYSQSQLFLSMIAAPAAGIVIF